MPRCHSGIIRVLRNAVTMRVSEARAAPGPRISVGISGMLTLMGPGGMAGLNTE